VFDPHLKMPRQPTATDIRLDSIAACLTPALALLKELNDAFGPPFIQTIVNTTETLINSIQVINSELGQNQGTYKMV
jgi:hypothetical protein